MIVRKENKTLINKHFLICVSFLYFLVTSAVCMADAFMISAPKIAKKIPDVEALVINAYQGLGIHAEIVRMPAKRALTESSKNTWVDAELGRVEGAKEFLPDFIMIPVPILTMAISSYSLKENINISNWQSLKGLDVLTMRGLIGINKNLEKNNIPYHEVNSVEQAIHMLKSERTDVIILPEKLLTNYIKAEYFTGQQVKTYELEKVKIFHFIHKKHSEIVPELTSQLQQQLEKIQ